MQFIDCNPRLWWEVLEVLNSDKQTCLTHKDYHISKTCTRDVNLHICIHTKVCKLWFCAKKITGKHLQLLFQKHTFHTQPITKNAEMPVRKWTDPSVWLAAQIHVCHGICVVGTGYQYLETCPVPLLVGLGKSPNVDTQWAEEWQIDINLMAIRWTSMCVFHSTI